MLNVSVQLFQRAVHVHTVHTCACAVLVVAVDLETTVLFLALVGVKEYLAVGSVAQSRSSWTYVAAATMP